MYLKAADNPLYQFAVYCTVGYWHRIMRFDDFVVYYYTALKPRYNEQVHQTLFVHYIE